MTRKDASQLTKRICSLLYVIPPFSEPVQTFRRLPTVDDISLTEHDESIEKRERVRPRGVKGEDDCSTTFRELTERLKEEMRGKRVETGGRSVEGGQRTIYELKKGRRTYSSRIKTEGRVTRTQPMESRRRSPPEIPFRRGPPTMVSAASLRPSSDQTERARFGQRSAGHVEERSNKGREGEGPTFNRLLYNSRPLLLPNTPRKPQSSSKTQRLPHRKMRKQEIMLSNESQHPPNFLPSDTSHSSSRLLLSSSTVHSHLPFSSRRENHISFQDG